MPRLARIVFPDLPHHITQRGNRRETVLDEVYLWHCVRYVERNPVRAGMVEKAEDSLWSSASAWLQEGDNPAHVGIFRRNINKNLPCGSDSFVQKLEALTGQILSYRPIGRPKKG